MRAKVRLYNFDHSPNPLKVRLALAELDVPYDNEEIRLFAREHRTEEFGKINPHRKVPVLEVDGKYLRESNAIITYLGESNERLWPTDPWGRAQAAQWLFFEAVHVSGPCGVMWWSDMVGPGIGRPGAYEDAVVAEAVEDLERSLGVLEGHLAQHEWILGNEFSLVDCSIGTDLCTLYKTRIEDADRWPKVFAYRDRIMARPSWEAGRGRGIHEFGEWAA